MSLDKLPPHHLKHPEGTDHKAPQQHQHHNHHQDLLSGDNDLLGGNHVDDNDFDDFKQATHSASPTKKTADMLHMKKAHSETTIPHQDQNDWDWGFADNNNSTTTQNQNIQKQPDNKVDVMKLYNQPQATGQQQSHGMGHQNHFAQGMQQGWHSNQSWNNGVNQGFNNGMGFQNQFQGGFQNNAGHQGFNQAFNAPMNYGTPMGGMQNLGFVQGPVQTQYSGNHYPNNGYTQTSSSNRFF